MTNSLPWYRWSIEIDCLPFLIAWWIFPWRTISHNQMVNGKVLMTCSVFFIKSDCSHSPYSSFIEVNSSSFGLLILFCFFLSKTTLARAQQNGYAHPRVARVHVRLGILTMCMHITTYITIHIYIIFIYIYTYNYMLIDL